MRTHLITGAAVIGLLLSSPTSGATGPLTFTKIADTSGSVGSFLSVSLNNRGTVAFLANLDGGGQGIFVGDGKTITPIADTSGPYSDNLGAPAINNRGTVSFFAALDAGGEGIFTGPDPVADKLIAAGDLFFDSTVIRLLAPVALNNSGQIAFVAELADGTVGIYGAKLGHRQQ
jgi:hypothetical protein